MQPRKLLANAKALRRNATVHERVLWQQLRTLGPRFRRQVPLDHYIADFVCFEHRLIIELDGGQHTERESEDLRRTAWLESQGFEVLRIWNPEVFRNIDGVMELIRSRLPPPP
ncbi:MAG: hypothetical protein JWM80_781 [Cyanobacteria bacterium RYN_339]|nr:hypothetical protein [Cyanobacteria bacterium RYN_339]